MCYSDRHYTVCRGGYITESAENKLSNQLLTENNETWVTHCAAILTPHSHKHGSWFQFWWSHCTWPTIRDKSPHSWWIVKQGFFLRSWWRLNQNMKGTNIGTPCFDLKAETSTDLAFICNFRPIWYIPSVCLVTLSAQLQFSSHTRDLDCAAECQTPL